MNSAPSSSLSINVGITGHRDIPYEDWPLHEKAIGTELLSLRKRFPNTKINVLCGLAEGADQLAASVALSHKFNVIAVLPFSISEYEKDFVEPQALAEFRGLLEKCGEVQICDSEQNTHRNEGYSELGRTLVKCSDVVIALWDGKGANDALAGGTADVVNMCIDGILDNKSLLFSKPNQTYCKWLMTRRSRHVNVLNSDTERSHDTLIQTAPANEINTEIGIWKKLGKSGNQSIDVFNENLSKLECFNKEAKRIKQAEKDTSTAYLLGAKETKNTYPALRELIEVYSIADCLAQARQAQRTSLLKLMGLLSFFAIFAQQIYAGLFVTYEWFAIHIVLVLVVIMVYRMFFYGDESKEEQFVEWRVFAENLRVQIFWHIAGISEHCSNNYRTTKLNEMDWIVDNLNKLTFRVDPPISADIDFVKERWVSDQCRYFYGHKGKNGRAATMTIKAKQYKRVSLALFCIALLGMLFSVFKSELGLIPQMSDDALFVIIALVFIGSALFATYAQQMGYEELSLRYSRTGYFFKQALNQLSAFDTSPNNIHGRRVEKYQSVIKNIGIEALCENAAWLQLHKMNAYQVQVT